MKKFILFFSFTFSTAFFSNAQEAETLNLVREGAMILAKQYYAAEDLHKAKTMIKFLTVIDKENTSVKQLITDVKAEKSIRVRQRLTDNGMQYSELLYDFARSLGAQSISQKSILAHVASVINSQSEAMRFVKNKAALKNTDYYKDIFPEVIERITEPVEKMVPTKVVNEIAIESLSYNPSQFLKAVSYVNYVLRKTGSQIFINNENMKKTEIKIDGVDREEGFVRYEGPQDEGAPDKNIQIENMSILEFLRYIEHTTRLSFILNDRKYAIDLIEAENGKNGRPLYFKTSESLKKDIQKSLTKSRIQYQNKLIQLKGTITKVANTDANFLIQLDNLIVIEIDKRLLKDDSQKRIETYLNDYNTTKASNFLKHLTVVVRGKAEIRTLSKIYIKNCHSILAEDAAYFYTK